MKSNRFRTLALLALLAACALGGLAQTAKPVRVRIVVGGHDHETSFYSLFEKQPDIRALVQPHPFAYDAGMGKNVDVLLLYDMVQDVPEPQKQHLKAFAESGKGIVVMHHALANFNAWPWWYEELVGGKYLLKAEGSQRASAYQHDVWMKVTKVAEHPVTRGVSEFTIYDESYQYMWISPRVKVLLRTDHGTSDGPVGWISPYEKSRVVVLQLGHGREAHENPALQRLVRQAILWAASRTE